MASQRPKITRSDMEKMTERELIEENVRLGERDDYSSQDVRSVRMEINEVRSAKQRERYAELKRKEERGELPPGQTVRVEPDAAAQDKMIRDAARRLRANDA